VKFSLDAGELARIVGAVKGCILPRTTMPILQHVRVDASAGRVTVRATCIDMEAEASASADVQAEGSIALPGDILHGLTRRLPKQVSATIELGGSIATLTAGRSVYRLSTLPVDTFPVAEVGEGLTFDVPAADLKSILEATVPATANSATHWYHRGVYLHTVERGELLIAAVATDDHRLAYREMAAPAGLEDAFAVTIPAAAVNEMIAILGNVDGDATLTIGDARVVLRGADAELSTGILEGKYPAYRRVMPEPNGALMTVRRDGLSEAVERAIIVCTGANQKTPAVGLVPGLSGLSVIAGTKGHEEANEIVDADVHERGDELGMNAAYLTQMLKLWPDVPIEVQSAGPGHPTLLWSKELPAYRQIIMPMLRK